MKRAAMKKRVMMVIAAAALAVMPLHVSASAGEMDCHELRYNVNCGKHALGNEYYTGINRHVGTQHQVQYGRKCSICGFVLTWWGEPYPCPGNGFCILPCSLELTEK